MLPIEKHVYYSVQAGICASSGSIFGKLSSIDITFTDNVVIHYIISLVFIGFMLISNAAVWTFFVKALQETNSSFIPTLSVSATNYILSAVIGWFVFGEPISLLWCLGTSLIIAGLILLATDSQKKQTNKTS